jgi:hypothetical protein
MFTNSSEVFFQRMKVRYILFLIFTFMSNLFFWYYMIVFCSVYVITSKYWLSSAIQALFIDWFIFELIQPAGLVGIRVICQKYKGAM